MYCENCRKWFKDYEVCDCDEITEVFISQDERQDIEEIENDLMMYGY
jgi:hypothetical protein